MTGVLLLKLLILNVMAPPGATTLIITSFSTTLNTIRHGIIELRILDTYAGKQLSLAATDV
jgi:hypothetical protein